MIRACTSARHEGLKVDLAAFAAATENLVEHEDSGLVWANCTCCHSTLCVQLDTWRAWRVRS